MPLNDYNTDPDLNVAINGISIAEGMAPGDVNGAARQMMADLATFVLTGGETHYSLRALVVPDGETGPTVPAIGVRKNKVLLFDNAGDAGVSAFTSSYAGSTSLMPDHRTVMAAYTGMTAGQSAVLGEDSREGLFVWSAANHSASVTSDPSQGAYVAPATDTTGTSGAWVRKYSGPLNVRWFGAKGDGVTNDYTAVAAAIAFAQSLSTTTAGTNIPSVYFPSGVYLIGANTIDITRPVSLLGENMRGTQLKWTGAVTGLRLQHGNTTGATGVQVSTGYATRAKIANMMLDGGYSGGAESDAHGVHARSTCDLENLQIENWPGEGIYIAANSAIPTTLGNANKCVVRDITTGNCRKGIYASGGDVNACLFTNCQGFGNRQWAFDDDTYGNTYVAPLAEGNARTSYNDGITVPCCYVTHSGNVYFCIPGQETGASTNAPSGTTANNQWWGYWQPGGTGTGIPTWFSGIIVRAGGGYFIENPSNTTTIVSPYGENDEISLVDQLCLITGKIGLAWVWRYSGGVLGGALGQTNAPNVLYASSDGLMFDGATRFKGRASFTSDATFFGPITGASNFDGYLVNTSASSALHFQSSAGSQTDALILSSASLVGLRMYGANGITLGTLSAGVGTDILSVTDTGLWLPSGATVKIDGLPIIGPRQAAIANPAGASAAPTQAEFNALSDIVVDVLDALRAHGLIAI